MAIPTEIQYKGVQAKVTPNGEIVTGSLQYSSPFYKKLEVDDQVYNIVPLVSERQFVIVGILLAADRNVTTDTHVELYESTSPSGVSSKDILQVDLLKTETLYMNLINVSTDGTKYINATCDDNNVDVTLFGYYAEVVED